MKRKLLIALLAILLCATLLTACGNGEPEAAEPTIVGAWECLDETIPHFFLCVLVFDANGRFTDKDGDVGTYIIDGDSLTLEYDGFEPFTFTFSLTANQLTLTGDGVNVVLDRQ